MSVKSDRGTAGENAVCEYLTKRGWKIAARNFRVRGGEIDIVAEKGDVLAFVEVKTRKFGSLSDGADAIDKTKRKCLIRAADRYIEKNTVSAKTIRFDAALVTVTTEEMPRVLETQYIEDAFDPFSL